MIKIDLKKLEKDNKNLSDKFFILTRNFRFLDISETERKTLFVSEIYNTIISGTIFTDAYNKLYLEKRIVFCFKQTQNFINFEELFSDFEESIELLSIVLEKNDKNFPNDKAIMQFKDYNCFFSFKKDLSKYECLNEFFYFVNFISNKGLEFRIIISDDLIKNDYIVNF